MYKAVDYFTNEIIIVTDKKEEVIASMNRWLENNPSSCIEVFKDGEMIYP